MQNAVAARLARLNGEFFDQHGLAFAETRPRLNPGVRAVLASIPPKARVLDAGCGDGKPGRFLSGRPGTYLGLDASTTMIERARALTGEREAVRFAPADVLEAGWAAPYREAFDWVLAFAVIHHIPGEDGRAQFVRDLATCCRPGARVAISCWRPSRSLRLLRRVVAWGEIGLSDTDVDPGDRLIGWERAGQRGWRYVHELEPAELDVMAERAGLALLDRFVADGHTGDLADYAVYKR